MARVLSRHISLCRFSTQSDHFTCARWSESEDEWWDEVDK